MSEKSFVVYVSCSKIKQVQLCRASVVSKVGWIWVALHDSHLEYFTESQLHQQSPNFIPHCLRNLLQFKIAHRDTFHKLGYQQVLLGQLFADFRNNKAGVLVSHYCFQAIIIQFMHFSLSLIVALLLEFFLCIGEKLIEKYSFWQYSWEFQQHLYILHITFNTLLHTRVLEFHCQFLHNKISTFPSRETALWTCPIDAAAKGFISNALNLAAQSAPRYSFRVDYTYFSGMTWACSLAFSKAFLTGAGMRLSYWMLSICATLRGAPLILQSSSVILFAPFSYIYCWFPYPILLATQAQTYVSSIHLPSLPYSNILPNRLEITLLYFLYPPYKTPFQSFIYAFYQTLSFSFCTLAICQSLAFSTIFSFVL